MSWPILLPHEQISRIVSRKASLLVLPRHLKPGSYEIHDAFVVRRNAAHRRQGRIDLTRDPAAFLIDITHVEKGRLLDMDLMTVRRTGFPTFEDFYIDWLYRRKRIDVDQLVCLHVFSIAEDARFLHVKSQRGYTANPAEAIQGEGQALSREEQARVSHDAFERDDARRREKLAEARSSSLSERVLLLEEHRRRHRVDITREFRTIEARLKRAERQQRPEA